MSGEAKTDNFMLGTATVMIGKMADLYDLNPSDHSIGLVKNFTNEVNKGTTDLTQGLQNDLVFSVTTDAPIRMSMEAYEYTDKNMSYALSLDGAAVTAVIGEAHTSTSNAVANTDPTLTDIAVDTPGTPQTYSDGDTVMVKAPDGNITLCTANGSVTTDVLTVYETFTTPETAIPSGSVITLVNLIDLGDTNLPEYYAVKVTGQLANKDWVTFLYPKVKMVSGLSMVFSSEDFNNMPLEMSPMVQLVDDPFYADFAGKKGKMARGTV